MIAKLFRRHRYMREHRWTHVHLSEYLDTELSELERVRVERHVEICPDCWRVLATLRRTVRALRNLGHATEPTVADGVIERLRSER